MVAGYHGSPRIWRERERERARPAPGRLSSSRRGTLQSTKYLTCLLRCTLRGYKTFSFAFGSDSFCSEREQAKQLDLEPSRPARSGDIVRSGRPDFEPRTCLIRLEANLIQGFFLYLLSFISTLLSPVCAFVRGCVVADSESE